MLFIDACPRGSKVSRTYRLAECFLASFVAAHPDESVETLTLADLDLTPYTGDMVETREALIDEGKLDDARFALARQFAAADSILIAAPYWDLMFPAMLKNYIEHLFVRKVAFTYGDAGPVGLCHARKLAYLTTSGSPIESNNFGGDYLRALADMLGVPGFEQVSCEGLDIDGADIPALMLAAETRARALAATF